jgi:molybdopterin-guanine dinucleotide biosynthesis protein A
MSDSHPAPDALRSMCAFILAGGRSGRFGLDKALLTREGKRFVDIVIDTCSLIFGEVYLVGKRYEHPNLTGCVEDERRGVGPIGGLLTALGVSPEGFSFVVGVDYPFIDGEVIRELGRRTLLEGESRDALVPVMTDGAHPLFAYYHGRCRPAAARCIEEGRYRLACLSVHARVTYLNVPAMGSGIPLSRYERSFININTPEEYDRFVSGTARREESATRPPPYPP